VLVQCVRIGRQLQYRGGRELQEALGKSRPPPRHQRDEPAEGAGEDRETLPGRGHQSDRPVPGEIQVPPGRLAVHRAHQPLAQRDADQDQDAGVKCLQIKDV